MQEVPNRIGAIILFICSFSLGCQGEIPAHPVEQSPEEGAGSDEAATSPLDGGDPFVAIDREVEPGTVALRRRALGALGGGVAGYERPEDFYLAVHRRELGKPWFLAAYLAEMLTAGSSGGGYSLGTRVVSFELQNDRLYVFDVDARKRTSDLFDPEVIIEAYPLVRGYAPFERMPQARDYVLIDPAAGLNHFSLLNDMFGAEPGAARFFVELSFLRRFRRIADGITYEQVFTGYSDRALSPGAGGVERHAFRASGSMGIALRRYREGEGFVQVPLPPQEHYFRSQPRVVPNTGRVEQVAIHWNIHPGMAPIEWVISPALAELDASPRYRDFDLVGAVRRGVESWNEVFGFRVFTTRVAGAREPLAVDDKNFILFDPNPSVGYAFAQFRPNPNTGEIRGASVYFGATFLDIGDEDGAGSETSLLALDRPAAPGLAWGPFRAEPLCMLWAPELHAHQAQAMDVGPPLSRKERLERSIAHVIAHEIGHTLGLRHNFKGSLVPPSSSVMDYLGQASLAMEGLGSYDHAAVRYLHGLSTELPREPFCTDDHVRRDPACQTFDWGADPLAESAVPGYEMVMELVMQRGLAGLETAFDYYSRALRGFVQSGMPDDALHAWEVLIAPVRAPLDPDLLAGNPGYGATADAVARRIFLRLFVERSRFDVIADAPADPEVVASILDEMRANLLDVDGVRSFETRRLCVDILKRMQTLPAYQVLLASRDALAAALDGSLDFDERALSLDLLARVDQAISPYFVK